MAIKVRLNVLALCILLDFALGSSVVKIQKRDQAEQSAFSDSSSVSRESYSKRSRHGFEGWEYSSSVSRESNSKRSEHDIEGRAYVRDVGDVDSYIRESIDVDGARSTGKSFRSTDDDSQQYEYEDKRQKCQ